MLAKPISEGDIHLKIVDFGINGSTRGVKADQVQALSLRYTPPEVVGGKYETSPKIDVWSLGIIFFSLLHGQTPFKTKNKEDLKTAILNDDLPFEELDCSEICKELLK